ncbi:MAG: sensor histidine kinase, partial [Acidithiobacillus sp.]|nr:sensor histidine kinase [Acidithiobacillus sp.]
MTAHISHFGALNFWRHLSVRSKSIIFVLMLIAGIYGMIVLFLYTAVEQNMEKQIHSKVLH